MCCSFQEQKSNVKLIKREKMKVGYIKVIYYFMLLKCHHILKEMCSLIWNNSPKTILLK